jgi:hypothetical protein
MLDRAIMYSFFRTGGERDAVEPNPIYRLRRTPRAFCILQICACSRGADGLLDDKLMDRVAVHSIGLLDTA